MNLMPLFLPNLLVLVLVGLQPRPLYGWWLPRFLNLPLFSQTLSTILVVFHRTNGRSAPTIPTLFVGLLINLVLELHFLVIPLILVLHTFGTIAALVDIQQFLLDVPPVELPGTFW